MIFFDLDNTLLDHDYSAEAGAAKFQDHFADRFKEPRDAFVARWNEVAERHYEKHDTGRQMTLWGQRRSRMRELFGEELSDQEADRRFRVYLDVYEGSWRLYPDTMPCLEALRGHRFGIITNGHGDQQRAKLASTGLSHWFVPMVASMEIGFAKPDKEIFLEAALRAEVDVKDCIYVGDRLTTDAIAGSQAGMKGIWLNRQSAVPAVKHGLPVIRTLAELPLLIGA